MSTFDQVREGLTRAWETVTDGWRELLDRAGDALTRFHPRSPGGEVESREHRIARSGARWGLLAAEVKVDDERVEVDLEVPGMNADDFDIEVRDDVLVVRGEKKVQRERSEGHFHIMERAYGAFERAVRLPVAVDDGAAGARYHQGVLHITLPRAQANRSRRISVADG